MKIIVTAQCGQYQACLETRPGIYGCGVSFNEAIGDLIRTLHGDVFTVEASVVKKPCCQSENTKTECLDCKSPDVAWVANKKDYFCESCAARLKGIPPHEPRGYKTWEKVQLS